LRTNNAEETSSFVSRGGKKKGKKKKGLSGSAGCVIEAVIGYVPCTWHRNNQASYIPRLKLNQRLISKKYRFSCGTSMYGVECHFATSCPFNIGWGHDSDGYLRSHH
jgi:hypothetical protein